MTMDNAGDRPPRYDKKTVLEPSRGTGPRATGKSRPEVSPTEEPSRPGSLSYGCIEIRCLAYRRTPKKDVIAFGKPPTSHHRLVFIFG